MSSLWYYKSGGKEFGPISSAELKRRARTGLIEGETPVRKAPGDQWLPACKVHGLFHDESIQTGTPAGLHEGDQANLPATLLSAATVPPTVELPSATPSPTAGSTGEPTPPGPVAAESHGPPSAMPGLRQLLLVGGASAAAVIVALSAVWLLRSGGGDESEAVVVSRADTSDSSGPSSIGRPLPVEPPAKTAPAPSPAAGGVARPESSMGVGQTSRPPTTPFAEPQGVPSAATAKTSGGVAHPESSTGVARTKPPPTTPLAEPQSAPPPAIAKKPDLPQDEEKDSDAPPAKSAQAESMPADAPGADDPAKVARRKPAEAKSPLPGSTDGQGSLDRRLLRLREIYEQVHQTTKQQKDAVSKLQDTDRELKEANVKRQNLTAELQTARQQQELLRQQRRQMAIQSGGKLPPGMSERFDMQYTALEQKAVALQTRIATLDVEMRSLQPGYKAAKDRVVELSGALPPDLFDEWFWLCDPFGRLPASMHERALKSLSRWLAENATFAPLHFANGFAHMGLKRYDRAEQDFDRVEELEKSLAGFCSAARGLIHARRGEARQASADFGKALKLKPKPGIVELFLAYGSLAQDKIKDAEKNFKQAAKLSDDSPHAREALALFLATHRADDSRSVKLAVEQATTAAEQTRWEEWVFLDTLSIALAASGDFEAAAGWSKKALKLAPPDCQAAVQARLALFESGKPYSGK